VLADELIEFHAARILILIKLCGKEDMINSLTKMAKLDFFVRYPQFFARACKAMGYSIEQKVETTESSMIRYHYGTWDRRYYHILAYLESRGLIEIQKKGQDFQLLLTDIGKRIAAQLVSDPAFCSLSEQMQQVNEILGNMRGTELKNLIYQLFDAEITQLPYGEE
jgi:predicted transcriptional regulator